MKEEKGSVFRRFARLLWGILPLLAAWTLQETVAVVGYGIGLGLDWILVLYQLAAIPIFYLWYRYGIRGSRNLWEIPGGGASFARIVAATAVGLQLGSQLFLQAERFLMPELFRQYVDMMDAAQVGAVSLPMILYTVLLGPVGEELIFRGLTLDYLEDAAGRFWIANGLQALLFGVYHTDIVQGCYTFLLGLVMGYSVEVYGTLSVGIFLHVLINGTGYLLANLPVPPALLQILEIAGALLALWGIRGMRADKERADDCRGL